MNISASFISYLMLILVPFFAVMTLKKDIETSA